MTHKIKIEYEIPSNGFCIGCPFLYEAPGFGDNFFFCRRFDDIQLNETTYNNPKPLPTKKCENKSTVMGWMKLDE
jgi:hypothetical protein